MTAPNPAERVELVTRLRRGADHLEGEGDIGMLILLRDAADMIEQLVPPAASRDALAKQMEELTEALGPFSAVIDENVPMGIALPRVGDYRRARRLYRAAALGRVGS